MNLNAIFVSTNRISAIFTRKRNFSLFNKFEDTWEKKITFVFILLVGDKRGKSAAFPDSARRRRPRPRRWPHRPRSCDSRREIDRRFRFPSRRTENISTTTRICAGENDFGSKTPFDILCIGGRLLTCKIRKIRPFLLLRCMLKVLFGTRPTSQQ